MMFFLYKIKLFVWLIDFCFFPVPWKPFCKANLQRCPFQSTIMAILLTSSSNSSFHLFGNEILQYFSICAVHGYNGRLEKLQNGLIFVNSLWQSVLSQGNRDDSVFLTSTIIFKSNLHGVLLDLFIRLSGSNHKSCLFFFFFFS